MSTYDGEMVDFSEMPIGNGPFMMTEPWAHDQYIKVEKNEDYYGDEPNIDGVDFMILADQDTAFLEFQAGNLDFTHIPDGSDRLLGPGVRRELRRLHRRPGEQVLLGPRPPSTTSS